MSLNPDIKKNAVDAACFLAVRAMLDEQLASIQRGEVASDPAWPWQQHWKPSSASEQHDDLV